MPVAIGLDQPDQIALWHRRGGLRYAIGLVIMLIATVVTGNFSVRVVLALLGAGLVAMTLFAVMVRGGLADRRWSLILWPVATCSAMSVLHTVSDATAGLLVGLIVLAFQFVGITQPPGTGLWFLLPAAFLLVQVLGLDANQALVRVPIAMLVWTVVSEAPSRLLGELRDKQRALEQLATKDALTGLLNRSRLEAHLESAGESSAVAVIDLDNFKEFNDAHGHIAGDLALMDFAEGLRANTRAVDAVFRYGGEEFLVIFPRTAISEAAETLDRFAGVWASHDSGVTFSAGVAKGGSDAVIAADSLLYKAKREGRARVLTDERCATA